MVAGPAERLSDAELVADLQAAPAEVAGSAAQELCRRFGSRIRLFGLRHLRDAEAAEDLVQEVLLIFLEAVRTGKLRDAGQTASFILGTCRNVVWNERRGNTRRRRVLERYGWELLPRTEDRPEPAQALKALETLETQEGPEAVEMGALSRCLARLSQRERQVLFFTFSEELPSRAIAERLQVTEGNVRVVRYRALAQLRDCLGVAGAQGGGT